ncbi:MAG: MFS transporter [Bradyrhizobium sp.]|nr:MFS transporter [Bradyrhizobium sp.]
MTQSSTIATGAMPRALIAIVAANTVIVATEFIVVGLLPILARDLKISPAAAGHLVGVFALSAALFGPPLTVAAGRLPSPRILIGALLLFAATDLAAVLWPQFSTIAAMRILQGAALPVFISVGAATVTELAAPERQGRALALANTGFAAGLVIALPAGVALARSGVWTPSFVALAVASLLAALLLIAIFPDARSTALPHVARAIDLLRSPAFSLHLLLSVAVFTAMFAAYSYISVWLAEIAGLNNGAIALALAGFGAAGLVGNTMAAGIADQAPLRATVVAVTVLAFAVFGLSLVTAPAPRIALFLLWGIAHTACVALCQVRVTFAGRPAPAFAMAMNISAANLGIALGAAAGGWMIGHHGINAIGWSSLAVLPAVAILALAANWRTQF